MPNLNRALGAVVLGLGLFLLGSFATRPAREAPASEAEAPMLGAAYAMPAERVETQVLERGQTLSDLLVRQRLEADMAELLLSLRQYLDPRRLAAGSEVTVRRWTLDGSPRAVEVRVNADSTVRLERGGVGWDGRVLVTPTVTDTVFLAGSIEAGRTLYEALVQDDELDLPARERIQLVGDLAQIYEFKLDFAHEIQPGDRYRLVLEREARPDGSARSRRILAAEIENQGRIHPAIHFRMAGERGGSYYDAEGRSLRLAFSRYPVDYVRITSSFNPRRYHPILGVHRAHNGTDFGAGAGTPVKATGQGTVIVAGRNGGYGNLVAVRHWDGYITRYAHLRGFAAGIRPGRRVEQGEVLGYVGATGLATAPHLHYEIRRHGKALNPRTVKLPGAPPIPAAYRREFDETAGARLALLERGDDGRSAGRLASTTADPAVTGPAVAGNGE